ncbi:DDHD domain protein [Cordyceps fumosorosea ARSEF 2679]|uniref:DDHD domain protein n=1 Tax=Cordyceps fumosorosea (strain ARSEF 2679) TaxID=1081104 RepID=A0A162MW71_CORFA|nr:DDHD domain protein [Cordyceps fumosorosea ARSEF 2679]OAA71549.1 DDHD domain protein [Cordyceps fumosorosea ARSEF 2679]
MADAAEPAQGLEAPPRDGAKPTAPDTSVAQAGENELLLSQAEKQDAAAEAITKQTMDDIPVPAQSSSKEESVLLTKGLNFLAKASPTTLAGIAVGFAGVTYAILGQFGLLVIGAVGGAAAFVVWEGRNPNIARTVRGEKGPDALERIWIDLQTTRVIEEENESDKGDQLIFKGFDDFRPETREALSGLVDTIIKDYVKWWYSPIIPTDHSFPLACRKTLTSYILAVSNRMARKRPADSFLDLLTNSSSIAIAFMSELAAAFADVPAESKMTAVDAVYTYLASNTDSRLANLLNQKQQAAKFKMVADDLLSFMEPSAYNCDPARALLREVLANTVLESLLQTCSKPEWINGWIVYLLEAGEPDINQAIDVGMQRGRDTANNIFADIDGNVGNIGIAKPASRSSGEFERGRRKEVQVHRKRLSKADEEVEVAIEEMKRMSGMMEDAEDGRRSIANDSGTPSKQSIDPFSTDEATSNRKVGPGAEDSTPPLAQGRSSPFGTSIDGASEPAFTPVTPRSTIDTSSQNSSSPKPERRDSQPFTNFDQIVPAAEPEQQEENAPKKAPLTLHNASFTLHDDATGDTAKIRSKPNWDYLIQVEPSSAGHTGWMIVRRYSDFETLHEILRRIATVSGATAFTELHKELPSWKIHSRESLRGELERYLRDACWYQSLAESEGMKRFLEKSQGHTHGNSKTFAWESVGKNMLDVLSIAPKGAMEGGKTLVDGVTGVFGNFPGIGKKAPSQSIDLTPSKRLSLSTPVRTDTLKTSPARSERASIDSQRSSVVSTQPGKMPMMERRPSLQFQSDNEADMTRVGRSERLDSTASASISARPSREHSRASSLAPPLRSPSSISLEYVKLPPPPDEMTDDYESHLNGEMVAVNEIVHSKTHSIGHMSQPSIGSTQGSATNGKKSAVRPIKAHSKLSEGETRVAVELIFAVINEMYTLSSAWNIRRTLLTAAKSFLLRPGNPSLLTVQTLIQSSVLDAYTADAGIAEQLRKVRENSMPTEEERAAWPAELTNEEKEQLAAKARKLLIQSGVPAALMGVMGQAATGEALGRVFDCLQIEEVARGLIFGLILQAVKVLTH